jgi:hypothetical protein
MRPRFSTLRASRRAQRFLSAMGDGAMSLEEITLALFAACNSVRVVAYVPQILKAATDKNRASSISFITWGLFLLAHLSAVAHDWGLAACFAANAACCVAILVVAHWKRRKQARRLGPALTAMA